MNTRVYQNSARSRVSGIVLKVTIIFICLIVFLIFARNTDTSLFIFFKGIPYMLDFLRRMFPPDFQIIGKLIEPAFVTFQISVVGTTIGFCVAFPLCFLGAKNYAKSRIQYNIIRILFNTCRGVSELVWAILFVSMVGLGPFPGVLAQVVYATGALGKYFSESIENMNPDSINALKATGANRFQIAFQGIVPELLPNFLGYVLWNWEHNIRSASVLGLVGAGGIGLELMNSMKLFRYQEALTILMIIVLLVTFVDRISAVIRSKILMIS